MGSNLSVLIVRKVVAARAAKRARSGGWGGGAWVGLARSKKEGCDDGYSHHRPRSGKCTVLQPVRATETRPLYQFFAAP